MSENTPIISTHGAALYFPYIHPRREAVLKAGLLYWDRIRRIVPSDLINPDGTVREDYNSEVVEAAKAGVLIATDAEDYRLEAEELFLKKVDDIIADKTIYSSLLVNPDSEKDWHIEKFGYILIEKLRNLGLAGGEGEWIQMNDELGMCYLYCLASGMSKKMESPLFTDSPTSIKVGSRLLYELSSKEKQNNEVDINNRTNFLLQLGIELPSPDSLLTVPMEKILKFHSDHSTERQRFRDAIEGIIKAASSDQNALQDHLNRNKNQIEEAVGSMRSAFDEFGVKLFTSAVSVGIPTGITTLAGLVDPATGAIIAGIGIAANIINWVAEGRGKRRELKKANPYTYLASLEKAFDRTVICDD